MSNQLRLYRRQLLRRVFYLSFLTVRKGGQRHEHRLFPLAKNFHGLSDVHLVLSRSFPNVSLCLPRPAIGHQPAQGLVCDPGWDRFESSFM